LPCDLVPGQKQAHGRALAEFAFKLHKAARLPGEADDL